MRVQALLKLHERQVDICDMINSAQNNINSYEQTGRIHRAKTETWYYAATKDHLRREIAKYKAIQLRLLEWYYDVKQRIEAIEPKLLTTTKEMDLATTLF